MRTSLIEFECCGYRFGLPLGMVKRVDVRAEATPLPGMGKKIVGALNIGGEAAVIIDFAACIGMPVAPLRLSQQMILMKLPTMHIGILVDQVNWVTYRDLAAPSQQSDQVIGDTACQSLHIFDDGLCVICDPERLISIREEAAVQEALGKVFQC